MIIKFNDRIVLVSIISILITLIVSYFLFRCEKYKDTFIKDILEIEKIKVNTEDNLKKDFMNKTFLARQVYQWSWWKRMPSKIGNLNTLKYYAMDLRGYNEALELSWKLNRQLNIPIDSFLNFIPLSKWILESSINPKAEHKTEEVLKFCGYVKDGFQIALYYYKFVLKINKGHPLYIEYIMQENIKEEDIISYLNNNILDAIRFDYAFLLYLLQEYNYQWDWVLTAFHMSELKTKFWWKDCGLKEIPSFRLDGKWQGYYLKEYYQTIEEIAMGIYMGKMDRISKWEEKVGRIEKQRNLIEKYIITFQLKVKSEQDFLEMNEKINKLHTDFTNSKSKWMELLKQMGELNDLNLQYRDGLRFGKKEWAKAQYKKILKLKNDIISKFKKLKKEDCK